MNNKNEGERKLHFIQRGGIDFLIYGPGDMIAKVATVFEDHDVPCVIDTIYKGAFSDDFIRGQHLVVAIVVKNPTTELWNKAQSLYNVLQQIHSQNLKITY